MNLPSGFEDDEYRACRGLHRSEWPDLAPHGRQSCPIDTHCPGTTFKTRHVEGLHENAVSRAFENSSCTIIAVAESPASDPALLLSRIVMSVQWEGKPRSVKRRLTGRMQVQ